MFEKILHLKHFFSQKKIQNLARAYGNLMNSIWSFISKRVAAEVTRLCKWGKPASYVARSAGYRDPLSRDHNSSTKQGLTQ